MGHDKLNEHSQQLIIFLKDEFFGDTDDISQLQRTTITHNSPAVYSHNNYSKAAANDRVTDNRYSDVGFFPSLLPHRNHAIASAP